MNIEFEQSKTDVLILGAGGAGLFAALHASNLGPDLNITIAVKGLITKTLLGRWLMKRRAAYVN